MYEVEVYHRIRAGMVANGQRATGNGGAKRLVDETGAGLDQGVPRIGVAGAAEKFQRADIHLFEAAGAADGPIQLKRLDAAATFAATVVGASLTNR
jgi:hypothetical protein